MSDSNTPPTSEADHDDPAQTQEQAPAGTAIEPASPKPPDSGIETEHTRAFTSDRWSRIASGLWIALVIAVTLLAGAFFTKPILGIFQRSKAPDTAAAAGAAPATGQAGQGREVLTGKQPCKGRKIIWYQAPMNAAFHTPKPGKSPMGMDLIPACYGAKKAPAASQGHEVLTGKQACEGRKIIWYQAPMNAAFHTSKPGKSPMGMDLIPACYGAGKAAAAGSITIDPQVRQDMSIVTAPVVSGPLVKDIRAVGYVDYDEPRLSIINTKIGGWVEKLYVDYTGQKVRRGQPLLSLYSFELISSQHDLLTAWRQYQASNSDADKMLLRASERRFRNWDISDTEIHHIEQTGKVQRTLMLRAPMAGVVIEKRTFKGAHVAAGAELFRIADLSRVWVYVHIYEMDVPFVKMGQSVSIKLPYDPGHVLKGRVDYIFPWVEDKSRDVKARLVFKNPTGALKPGMYVTANIHADLKRKALLVDDSAVIRSGTRNLVFVSTGGGTFAMRTVKLGVELQNTIQILSGLQAGDQAVIDGQFMLDSESRLKDAAQKYLKAKAEGPGSKGATKAGSEPAAPAGSSKPAAPAGSSKGSGK